MATLEAQAAEFREPLPAELLPECFPPMKNTIILQACRREDVPHVPVWVMRQAGRYLPEFQGASAGLDFFKRCQTPALACQLTLQPVVRFPLDAAIIFSDILVVPQALGLECIMSPGEGPQFPAPIVTPEDLDRLHPDVDVDLALGYVFKAITLTRHRLAGHVPLIGFAGAPWTLFAYAIEGKGSKTWDKAKAWLYTYPEASHRLLAMITDTTVRYLVGQVRAGAQLLQVFDSWAGVLSQDLFREFALPYLARIASAVKHELGSAAVPMICFAKGAHWAIKDLESTDYDGLDETANAAEILPVLKGRVALQGNLDPAVMYASDAIIEARVAAMMASFGTKGHIANLGHGMTPSMQPRSVAAFVHAVHKYSSRSPVVRIGTRSSVLAMWQTRWVLDRLTARNPGVRFEVVPITPAGDSDLQTDLTKFSQTGVFTDALEQALLRGAADTTEEGERVDVLVHSLKDLPSTLREGTALAAIGPREDPRDVVVFSPRHAGKTSLQQLQEGSVVGTSSSRRRAQLAHAYPHLRFAPVRGNVMTRLRKLDDYATHGLDALCLAAAGLKRLSLHARIDVELSVEESRHAIGQGALGVQVRTPRTPEEENILTMCREAVNDPASSLVCTAERAFLRTIGGGCSLPIAVSSQWDGTTLTLTGLISSMDGRERVERALSGPVGTLPEAEALGADLCSQIRAAGGDTILLKLRESV